jgi:hypothetical protein
VQWPLVLTLFCLLWAAVAYVGVHTIAAPRTDRANLYAAGSALAVALVVGVVLTRVPRQWAPPSDTAVVAGHPYSCARGLTAAGGVAHGSVDVVQTLPNAVVVTPAAVIERTSILVVRGWATDAAIHHPIAGVCLLVDGKPLAQETVLYGATRSDVAQAFKEVALVNTGFDIRAAAAELTPGPHRLEVVGVDERGRESPIAPPLRVTVR